VSGQRWQRPGGEPHFGQLLGLELVEAAGGTSRIRLQVRPELLNFGGAVHGGVISSMVDVAIGVACHSLDAEGRRPQATTDLNVTFVRPARDGVLECVGRIRRRGRSLAVGEAEVSDGEGRLVALGRATYLVGGSPPRQAGEGADDALGLGGQD
jgi:acyl-CoA thioesterase